jgi:lysozyme
LDHRHRRLIDARKGGRLTDDEIDYLLANDIREKTAECRAAIDWFDELDPVRQEVVVGMAFQLGVTGLMQFKQTLAYLRDERWPQAAGQMLASAWAKQTPARAARMARAVETGERQWPST